MVAPEEYFKAFCRLFGIDSIYKLDITDDEIRLRACAEICAECYWFGCDNVDNYIRYWMNYANRVFDHETYNMRWVREKCCEAIMQYPDNELKMEYLRYMHDSGYVNGLDEFRPGLRL